MLQKTFIILIHAEHLLNLLIYKRSNVRILLADWG